MARKPVSLSDKDLAVFLGRPEDIPDDQPGFVPDFLNVCEGWERRQDMLFRFILIPPEINKTVSDTPFR